MLDKRIFYCTSIFQTNFKFHILVIQFYMFHIKLFQKLESQVKLMMMIIILLQHLCLMIMHQVTAI
jgi:hypothetical protein